MAPTFHIFFFNLSLPTYITHSPSSSLQNKVNYKLEFNFKLDGSNKFWGFVSMKYNLNGREWTIQNSPDPNFYIIIYFYFVIFFAFFKEIVRKIHVYKIG